MVEASVVVPAYDELGTIGSTLDSLAGQSAEVVVVVDGSDGTETVARTHPAVDRVVAGTGEGAGAARNLGVEHADGDVILFTDADTLVPENWVDAHLRHYDDPDVVGVGGPAAPISDRLTDRLLFRVLSDYWYRVSWPLGFVQQPGFNCSVRRSAFQAIGGFDEAIPFMEDTELSLRLKREGRIVYDPATEVETSARREATEGYGTLFAKYARAYLNHYVLDRDLEEGYFRRLK